MLEGVILDVSRNYYADLTNQVFVNLECSQYMEKVRILYF